MTILPEPDAALCRDLAADLRDADYTSAALRGAWGPVADAAIPRGLRSPATRALAGRADPLAVLGRLFALGMPQPAASVELALPRTGVDGVVRLGLAARSAEPEGLAVRPLALVRPQSFADEHGDGEWLVASDLDEAALQGPLPEDHVLGVGGASLTLAGLQLPTPVRRALDVGTGCGIQALRARRSVERVVATDVSERALRFTDLNALLNGVDGIETRLGSLFEPVAGEDFDRIVSNPPFVITPRAAGVPSYEYRDGGMIGDDLVAAFVAEVGARLAPGGVAQLLGNWETRGGVDGLDRVREWVARSSVPLDAWVVEREILDPVAYAELWIRDGGALPGSPRFTALVEAWLDDFAGRGVSAVGFGYILLRRPVAGAGAVRLARYERMPQPLPDGGLGAHLADALAAHDRLAALVGACDGDLPAGILIDAIAELLEVDAAELRGDLLPRVRELVFTGFLRFA